MPRFNNSESSDQICEKSRENVPSCCIRVGCKNVKEASESNVVQRGVVYVMKYVVSFKHDKQ